MNQLWCPERGEVIWLTFTPQAGSEQAGRSPALVLSPLLYNSRVGLVLVCPVTTRVKGYPFEVVLPEGLEISGAVLSDQIKSLDWRVRGAEFICKVAPEITADVLAKVTTLLA